MDSIDAMYNATQAAVGGPRGTFDDEIARSNAPAQEPVSDDAMTATGMM
eukprot:SAG11_NODE_33001_length_279_cov_1.416667_1_plen_48_part_10